MKKNKLVVIGVFALVLVVLLASVGLYFSLQIVQPANKDFYVVMGSVTSKTDDLYGLNPPVMTGNSATIGPYTIDTEISSAQYVKVFADDCDSPDVTSHLSGNNLNNWYTDIKNGMGPYITTTNLAPETFVNSKGQNVTCPVVRTQIPSTATYKYRQSGTAIYRTAKFGYSGADYTFGGRRVISNDYVRACWEKTTIKKNGVVVFQDADWRQKYAIYKDAEINILLRESAYFRDTGSDCFNVRDGVQYRLPSNAIDVQVVPFADQVFEGSQVKADVIITNNWTYDVEANVTVDFEIPTGLSNPSTETRSQLVTLKRGVNKISYTIPTAGSTTELRIKPTLTVYLSPQYFKNVNWNDKPYDHYVSTALYPRLRIGSLALDQKTVRINAKPLYLPKSGNDCSIYDGYVLNQAGDYCIRVDLSKISCVQLGCPAFEDYTCTSAGVCAQVISKIGCSSDKDCAGIGGVCEKNSQDVSFCVNEKIREVEVNVPVTVDQSCSSFDFCADGYDCEDRDVNGKPVAYCVGSSDVPDGASMGWWARFWEAVKRLFS